MPIVALVGEYENKEFEQTDGGVSELVNVGEGLTVTVTFWEFEHPLAVSVKTYITLIEFAVVLISISFGLPDPEAAGLLIPATAARLHVNMVPAVELVGL